MDDHRRLEAKQLARAKARSRRRRVSLIRQRTFSGSVALFAIAWAIIFGQLALGRDPALSNNRKVASAQHNTAQVRQATVPASTDDVFSPAPQTAVAPQTAPLPQTAPPPAPIITSSS